MKQEITARVVWGLMFGAWFILRALVRYTDNLRQVVEVWYIEAKRK